MLDRHQTTIEIEPTLSRRGLVALFLLALAARLVVFFAGPFHDPQRAVLPDSTRYAVLADNLVRFHTFGKAEEDGLLHQAIARLRAARGTLPGPDANGLYPESFRTPGYPLFLAAVEACGGGLRAMLLAQCVLGSLLPGLVVGIATALGLSRRGAILAGVLWALHPGLVFYDVMLLSEDTFNFCAVVALALAARAASPGGSLLAGAMLGGASLVRPLGLLYLPAALALSWRPQPMRWVAASALVAATLLPPGLWALRNKAAGEGLRVSTIGDLHVLYQSAAFAISEERGEDWLASWPARVRELTQKLEERVGPGEDVFAAARKLAMEELARRPVAVARVHVKSLVKLLLDHSLGDAARLLGMEYRPTGIFSRFVLREEATAAAAGSLPIMLAALAWMGLNALVAGGAFLGLLVAARRRAYRVLIVGGVMAALFMAASGSVGLERFRLPILLPLFILVGYLWPARMTGNATASAAQSEPRP